MAFGYKNAFGDKSFDFGTAFKPGPTQNLNDLFDYRKYNGDFNQRDTAIGRMAAGSMGMSLTDTQLRNLGAGLSSMYSLVDLKNRADGDTTASTTWDTALNNDRVNSYLQNGDVLDATGWGGTNAGTAFGQIKANAQAAQTAGDQTAYGALTSGANFDQLGELARRSMGGVGLDMFNRVNNEAGNAGEQGGDPFNVQGSNYFGGTSAPTWHNPNYTASEPEQPTGELTGNENTPLQGQPFGAGTTVPEIPGNASGAPGTGGTQAAPRGGAGSGDYSPQVEQTFREAQGAAPDKAQLWYWNDWAKRFGLDGTLKRLRNNVYTRAYQYYGSPLPPIRDSNDRETAGLHYDRLIAVPGNQGEINQPKEEWVNNILGIYAKAGA